MLSLNLVLVFSYNYVNFLVIFFQIFVRYRKIEISMLPILSKFFRKKVKKIFLSGYVGNR